jgi:hypothetical protein
MVSGINTNSNKKEKEFTKNLIGFIVAAKRPLKLHEIQAALSINTEKHTEDFENRSPHTHIRDICGSLVEILPGERVQLVHWTAKE